MSTNLQNVSRKLSEAAEPPQPPGQDNSERAAAPSCPPPFFAQTCLLHEEKAEEFQALRDALLDEHQPQTPTELYFVNEMANAQWRLRRIRLVESGLIRMRLPSVSPNQDDQKDDDDIVLGEAVRLAAHSNKALQYVLRHEAALRRQFERALRMFWECRDRQARRTEREAGATTQKLQERSQSSPGWATFQRGLQEFLSAPPPMPPLTQPAPVLRR